MLFKYFFVTLVTTVTIVTAARTKIKCKGKIDSIQVNNDIFNFTLEILDRVRSETNGHFVFSPISTWYQLLDIMEGAKGYSEKQISTVAGIDKQACQREHQRKAMGAVVKDELGFKMRSVMIADELLDVNRDFVAKLRPDGSNSRNTIMLQLDFLQSKMSTHKLNEKIAKEMDGVSKGVVQETDFSQTFILMYGLSYFRQTWPAVEKHSLRFYTDDGHLLREMKAMTQIGKFKVAKYPSMDILSIPCTEHDNVDMLIFMPKVNKNIQNIFRNIKEVRLQDIFSKLQRKRVKLQMPIFKMKTGVDVLPKILSDMGIQSIFYLDNADLIGISDYKINVSIMKQYTTVAVDAKVPPRRANQRKIKETFVVNKPFGYMIVETRNKLYVPLFAGIFNPK